jgi:cytochrome c-type biogenesis protein CcmE
MTRKKKRFALIISAMVVLGGASGLVLYALRGNIVFFYTPSEVVAKKLPPGTRLRIGGLVKKGSVVHDGTTVHFVVTDGKDGLPVTFTGALPDLFREGQGVVAEGALEPSGMVATDVLAKHDERYMPREVAEALKKRGLWKEGIPPEPGAANGTAQASARQSSAAAKTE